MYQIYFILDWHCTCFRRSFCPSSGVQDCTYSNRHLSNRRCCLLASGYPLASRRQYLFDKCLLLFVQSWTPDDGQKDRLKHYFIWEWHSTFDTLVHEVDFSIEIYSHCYIPYSFHITWLSVITTKRINLCLLQSFSENIPTVTFIHTLHFEISETLIVFFLTSGKEGRYQVILKKVNLPVVTRDTCLQALRKTRLGPYFNLHESFICAGGVRGKDTCKVMTSC